MSTDRPRTLYERIRATGSDVGTEAQQILAAADADGMPEPLRTHLGWLLAKVMKDERYPDARGIWESYCDWTDSVESGDPGVAVAPPPPDALCNFMQWERRQTQPCAEVFPNDQTYWCGRCLMRAVRAVAPPPQEFSLQWAVETVVAHFEADEAQGYHSRDRQYALSMLKKALEVQALRAVAPPQEDAPDRLMRRVEHGE